MKEPRKDLIPYRCATCGSEAILQEWSVMRPMNPAAPKRGDGHHRWRVGTSAGFEGLPGVADAVLVPPRSPLHYQPVAPTVEEGRDLKKSYFWCPDCDKQTYPLQVPELPPRD